MFIGILVSKYIVRHHVNHCTRCGHTGQLHLAEAAQELTTACSIFGAEALAEWDGGVVLDTHQPE